MKRKMISILLVVVMMVMLVSSVAFADATPPPIGGGNINAGILGLGSTLLGYVQWVGYAIAIGMLIYIGIKYVTASADTKADLKAAMIKYVIGALLIAAASTIAGWIFSIGDGLKSTSSINGSVVTSQESVAMLNK